MDGVGDVTWIDMDVANEIVSGFFKGLALQADNSNIPHALVDAFKAFILQLPEKDIQDIFKGIVHQIDPKSPELPAIKQNLDAHVEAVLSGLRQLETVPP